MTDAPIAGWYPDPRNADAAWRWWNGRGWTHEVAPRVVETVAAPVRRAQDWGWAAAPPAATPTYAAPSSSPNTVWIWLLAFSIYIFGAVAGVLQGVGMVLAPDQATRLLVGVGALVIGVVPLWVFAELDGRALRTRGFEAPSVLWMLLLPPLVYFAVRARKLKRVGARSRGPETALLIVIVVQILSGIAAGLFAYSLLQALLSGSPALG